jgi:hypothetical protein
LFGLSLSSAAWLRTWFWSPSSPLRRRLAPSFSTLPDEERTGAIGELYKDDKLRTFAELMFDLEEEPAARALVVGELRRLAQQS